MLRAFARPTAALAAALGLMTLAVLLLGANPIVVFSSLAVGAAGSWLALTDTLVKATPLIFTGLAVSIAFHGALWNIGAEGQLLAGALVATVIGVHMTDWPHSVALPLVLLSGAIAGAASGGFCGWLKARRGTNEVISTIMMNFIALELVSWAVHGPLIEASHAYPESDPVAVAATFSTFMPPSRLNSGILLAVVLALATHLVIYRTDYGFRLRAFGQNRRASAFFGIAPTPATIVALAVSGAFAGLGGAVQLAAINHRLFEHFSPGWGFEGIAVALVARLNPAAVVGSALFFGALDNGAQAMQRSSGISPVFVQVVQGLIIFILLALDATGLGQTPKLLSASEPETPSAAEISRAANA